MKKIIIVHIILNKYENLHILNNNYYFVNNITGDKMIENYQIKKVNDKEILYIFFNIDFEYAKLNNKDNSIEKLIKNFIKKNKIKFHGTIVGIVVGGTLIGNIIFNKPISNNYDYFYKPDILEVDKMLYIPNIEVKKEEPIIDEVNINNELSNTLKDTGDVVIKKKSSINNKNSTNANTNINQNTINQTNINSNINDIVEIKEEKQEITEEVDNNTYVNIKRKNGNIETIELETYIIGVVGAEMPASFHEEALKSQAIISRTYALKAISTGKQLTDNESTQSYKSNSELKSMWGDKYNTYYTKIKNCVEATRGMYLTYNGKYIEAVYHSTSNGITESSLNVWNNYYPYLVSVDSPYDSTNSSFIQEVTFSYQDISSILNLEINSDSNIDIIRLTESGRVESLSINGKIFTGLEFRQKLGLRSTDFTISKMENLLKITTKGYGHGVGLSQYGANGFAKQAGYNYVDILKHYYKGVTISHK